ncbi:MFS general substrate transporter [Lentinus tigrinus ALCF2SS1-7]|uniref:MFS general substrate transporter n=1 Tax=Lentinus tigrinus ALCF2SS1-6 TaxID=1328759 RepID=A0A5C2SLE2_9APHY|nr:MFS general substrate transporter [Lentinus tigrinus ALCF2SS1-6]RPD76673.1 MFS general substrate transporter [Lentinus tigrinus ALCF2SS1-7]
MRTPHVEREATPVDVAGSGSNAKRSVGTIDVRLSLSRRSPETTLDDTDAGEHKHPHDEEKGNAKLQQEPTSEEGSEETIYVEFEQGDPRNPANFSYTRKWAMTIAVSFFSLIAASSSGAYALGFPSMTRELNASQFEATLGLSMWALALALVPLWSTSFSEEFGRQPIYIISGAGSVLMHLMVALAQNVQTVIIGRFFGGAFGSTAAAMVGGTIADIWAPSDRGLPMSVFAIMIMAGPGIGCVAAGSIEQNPHLEWRWIQWIHVIFYGTFLLTFPFIMRETRPGVLLKRKAERLRKKTGNTHYRARVEDQYPGLSTLIYVSCTRALYLLFTEPVVASFSLWAGFAWGILFVLVESIGPAFRSIHHFSTGEVGTVFASMIAGCIVGEVIQIYQERLYARYYPTKGPEARLFSACLAAILFPTGMFIYAWCTFPNVPWIGMAMGIFVIMTSLFILYVAVFTYLADCYGIFASSALAGQSLSRNLMGAIFPLFSQQMFDRLTYHWGNTLFACIATLMIPIPFVLYWKGPAIRARSKFASQVIHK